MAIKQTSIYIVDDDPFFCKSLERMLKARGFPADCFLSAKSFLDSVSPDQKKGIAIVDINMPQCDGFALMDKMKNMGYRIPVIVITAKPQKNSRALAMEREAIGYLEKPFSERSLLDLIETQKGKNDLK